MRTSAFLLALALIPTISLAATIEVPKDHKSIQDAIDAAIKGDTVLVSPGTYVENINFNGKAITVTSAGGAEITLIDGGIPKNPDFGSVVTFSSNERQNSVLAGFTLTNGSGTYSIPNRYYGGGIYCINSAPTIKNNIIANNLDLHSGAGIYCENASPTIKDNTIEGNRADYYGAGIHCDQYSSPDITSNIIKGNTVKLTSGGGIYCYYYSSPTITHNIISENLAPGSYPGGTDGGGIACYQYCSPIIMNNSIIKNQAGVGGGINCHTHSCPTIVNNTISGNVGFVRGGGIACTYHSSTEIKNNSITNNFSNELGGGIILYDSGPIIFNNTISDNAATLKGGGIFCWYGGNPNLRNNIISGNTSGSGGGIYSMWFSDPILFNNTITGNTALLQSGGGIFCDDCQSTFKNNLITGNLAKTDGGGIFCDNLCKIKLHSNTIAKNAAQLGSGIWCGNASSMQIQDTIIWNLAPGPEIWLGHSGNSSILTISHSDVRGGKMSVHVAPSCILNWGVGMMDKDPEFAAGPKGFYYLSQIAAGQSVNSPCVDAGSDQASNLGMGAIWTRTDEVADSGMVDMGYHYGNFIYPSFYTDHPILSETIGGAAKFLLRGEPVNGNKQYMILGGVSGTSPGFVFPGSDTTLPVKWDLFTNFVFAHHNLPFFKDFVGTLDYSGNSEAAFNLPPIPGFSGIRFHFAYGLVNSLGAWDFASNAVLISITP